MGRNQTETEPVIRFSSDNGETLGSVLRLSANGKSTIMRHFLRHKDFELLLLRDV
jgi:hypothetical protein